MIRRSRWVSVLLAATVVSGSLAFYNDNAIAQASAAPAATESPSQDGHVRHGPRGRDGAGLGRIGADLQLTDAQRQSIAQIMRDSRTQARQRIYALLTPAQQAKLPQDFLSR